MSVNHEKNSEKSTCASNGTRSSGHLSWYERANALGEEWAAGDIHESNHRLKMIHQGMELAYERLTEVYKNKLDYETRGIPFVDGEYIIHDVFMNHVMPLLEAYDPRRSSLGSYLSSQIRLKQATEKHRSVKSETSLPTVEFDERRRVEANVWAKPDPMAGIDIEEFGDSGAEEYTENNGRENTEREDMALQAMVINFKNLQAGAKHQKRIRLYKLQYTERLIYLLHELYKKEERELPWDSEKDLLYALDAPYFRYLTVPIKEPTITLRTVEQTELKSAGELIPGKPMDEPIEWKSITVKNVKFQLLPPDVQRAFWKKEENEDLSLSTISTRRHEYFEALFSFISKI